MINLITQILTANYAFEGYSLIFTFLESQFAISLFCAKIPKKRPFALRALFAVLECAMLCYLLAILNTEVGTLPVRVICYLSICVLNLGFLFFCWDGSQQELFMAFTSGLAAYQIGNKFYPLLQNLNGVNDRATISLFRESVDSTTWEWIVFYLFRFGMYFLLAWIFRPKGSLAPDRKTRRNIIFLSLGTVIIVNMLVCIARVFEHESMTLNIVVKLFTIAFSFVILLIGAGIFNESEKARQIGILNQLMRQEKAQFDSVKANMDVINMKCHDLKHIIDKIEDKLTGEETDTLREAIRFYDANIKTGNDVLDVVLCEKAMQCEKNGITFSCMANGEQFRFLTAVQTYSLFGNIIDNAIEAIQKLDDPDQKVISLVCAERNGCPVIEESNYFAGDLKLVNGMPVTGKEDSARHGFGTKSIRYIAEQYGGRLEIKTQDNMFFLQVAFPKQA